jgi:hypothetical protein
MSPESTSPESRAFAVLLAVQDELPQFDARLWERSNLLVVLVDSIEAWRDWTLHLLEHHSELVAQTADQLASLETHLESYLLVERYPVEVVRGLPSDAGFEVAA